MSMTTIIAILENKGIVSHEEAEKIVHHLDNHVQSSNYRDAVYEVRNLLQPLADPQPHPLNAPVGPEQANEELAARANPAASATPEQTVTHPDGTTTQTQAAGATPAAGPDPDTIPPQAADAGANADDKQPDAPAEQPVPANNTSKTPASQPQPDNQNDKPNHAEDGKDDGEKVPAQNRPASKKKQK